MSVLETSPIFPLKYLAAVSVAKLNNRTAILPHTLNEYISNMQLVLQKASSVTADVSLFKSLHLQPLDKYIFPQYDISFPLDTTCYAEIKNSTTGIEAVVNVDFSALQLSFLSSCNISMADILQFLSDISGEFISVPDIQSLFLAIETDMPSPDAVYCIKHEYRGPLSTLKDAIKTFKSRATNWSHISHYSKAKHSPLVCSSVTLYLYSSSELMRYLEE